MKRTKLDRKAQRLVFVGYCEDRKAYRFLDPSNDTITISRDARFIELNNGSLNCDDSVNDVITIGDNGWLDLERVGGEEEKQPDCEGQEENDAESEEEFYGWENEEQTESEEESAAGGTVPVDNSKRSTRGKLPRRLEDYAVGLAVVKGSRSYGRRRVKQEQCYSCHASVER